MSPLRLRSVEGHDGRSNDVLFQPAAPRPRNTTQTVVFFGGDVQDYPEVMQANKANRRFLRWNLESTARRLADTFPGRHVLVVRPSRVECGCYSCYDHFVPSDETGAPDHTPNYGALVHLYKLLKEVTNRLKLLPPADLQAVSSAGIPKAVETEDLQHTSKHCEEANGSDVAIENNENVAGKSDGGHRPPPSSEAWWRDLALHESSLSLVGFSKGCVVLNQFIYEIHYTKTVTPGNADMMRLIERVREAWWLDGGHAGDHHTWLTPRHLLETLAGLRVKIMVVVSPHQVEDAARPWIRREEQAFTHTLTQLGAHISRFLHKSPGGQNSLQTHFEVLDNFKRVHDAHQL